MKSDVGLNVRDVTGNVFGFKFFMAQSCQLGKQVNQTTPPVFYLNTGRLLMCRTQSAVFHNAGLKGDRKSHLNVCWRRDFPNSCTLCIPLGD